MLFNKKRLNEAFDLMSRGIEEKVFPCAATAVGDKNGVVALKVEGLKGFYPHDTPLNITSLFDLASLTKVVATTPLLMVMIEKGLISIYDKVYEYLPSFRGRGKEAVTIFDLITHTSGLPAYIPLYKVCKDYEDSIDYICREVQLKKPGYVEYSDLGFILLGKILELVGNNTLDKLCHQYIFEPLEMKNTCFNPLKGDVVPTEKNMETGEFLCGVCHDENARFFGGISGHAGLFSCILDLIKFADMLVNCGKTKAGRFISLPLFRRMIMDYTGGKSGECRGWGWCVKGNSSAGCDLFSEKAFGHTGFTGTSIWVDPVYGIYIILLTNRVHLGRENNKIVRFRRLFMNMIMASLIGR